jgi:hypothetical protein
MKQDIVLLIKTSIIAHRNYVSNRIDNCINKEMYLDTMNHILSKIELSETARELLMHTYNVPIIHKRWYNIFSSIEQYQELAKTHSREIIININKRFDDEHVV